MKLKTRARIAVEAGKTLFPELFRKDKEVFSEAVKSIALMDKEDLLKLNERSVLVAHSSHFINASSADFYRLQELYQDKKPEMHKEYSDEGHHKAKEDYEDPRHLPKEDSDGKQVKESPVWLSEVAEVVRNELERLLPKKNDDYEYPDKNIAKESSRYGSEKNQSDNSYDIVGKDAQAVIDADQKEALDRAETKAGEGEAGDGQVLYDPKVHDKDPYGYSQMAPQPVEGESRKASAEECGETPPADEDVAGTPAEVDEEPVAEEEAPMDYPEEEEVQESAPEEEPQEVAATMEEDKVGEEMVVSEFSDDDDDDEMAALFGPEDGEAFSFGASKEESHSITASAQKGRIPNALMVRSSDDVATNELVALFGEEY